MGKQKSSRRIQRIQPPSEHQDKNLKSTSKNTKVSISPDAEYPLFCFKYLSEKSLTGCKDHKFLIDCLVRLHKLSELGWKTIRESNRHGFGLEKIPKKKIKPEIPRCVTPEVKELDVFRASGDNRVFVGIQDKHIFRVLFIETKFGDIYDH